MMKSPMLLAFAALLATGAQTLTAMTISGSDLLDKAVQDALEASLAGQGIEAELLLDGSLKGTEALESGSVDAAILAVPDGGEGAPGLRTFPFGFQIVTILVHASNPVTELSYGQLNNLFSDGGSYSNWSDLTEATDWANRKISFWIYRSPKVISLEIFNAIVLKGTNFKSGLNYSASVEDLVKSIVEDPSALVLAPSVPANSNYRSLAIKSNDSLQAYSPSPDNILFGDYPLRLPFILVVSSAMSESDLGKLLQAVYSAEVTAALVQSAMVPVPETEIRAILGQL